MVRCSYLTSSLAILMSSWTSENTVGWMKKPLSPCCAPPYTRFAPSLFPLSIRDSIFPNCSLSTFHTENKQAIINLRPHTICVINRQTDRQTNNLQKLTLNWTKSLHTVAASAVRAVVNAKLSCPSKIKRHDNSPFRRNLTQDFWV